MEKRNEPELTTRSATAHLRPPLPATALHGLAGDVARVLSEESGADPAGILLVFLTMLGNAVGPQPHLWFGRADHAARHFVLLVGDAATGGKGTILNVVEQLFADAEPEWYQHRRLDGLQNPEAMIEPVADDTSGDCRLLIIEPEFARLASRMTSSGTAFSAQLRKAYDGSPLAIHRTSRPSVYASHPHISLIGQITPGELMKLHGKLRSGGGLETRLLYAIVTRQSDVNPFTPPSAERQALIERLQLAIEASRASVMERTDPISQFLCLERGVQPSVQMPVARVIHNWKSIKARLPVIGHDFRNMTRRGETHVMRLALSYAIADQATYVEPIHIDAAIALWTYCAQSAERIFGTPTGRLPPKVDPKRRGQLFEFLAEHDGWVSRDHITGEGLFRHNLPKVDFDAIVESLEEDELIEKRTTRRTGGAPRTEIQTPRNLVTS